jgi:hypothetical protein
MMCRIDHRVLAAGLTVLLAGPVFAQAVPDTTGTASVQSNANTAQFNRLFGGLNAGQTSGVLPETVNPTFVQVPGTVAATNEIGLQYNRLFGGLAAGQSANLVSPSWIRIAPVGSQQFFDYPAYRLPGVASPIVNSPPGRVSPFPGNPGYLYASQNSPQWIGAQDAQFFDYPAYRLPGGPSPIVNSPPGRVSPFPGNPGYLSPNQYSPQWSNVAPQQRGWAFAAEGGGVFTNPQQGLWTVYRNSGNPVNFLELYRTPSYAELYNPSAGTAFRLSNNMLYRNYGGVWYPVIPGRWQQ